MDAFDIAEQSHKASISNTYSRLTFERCWMLHRALTLNKPADADSWKGSSEQGFTDQQTQELLTKYHDMLMNL